MALWKLLVACLVCALAVPAGAGASAAPDGVQEPPKGTTAELLKASPHHAAAAAGDAQHHAAAGHVYLGEETAAGAPATRLRSGGHLVRVHVRHVPTPEEEEAARAVGFLLWFMVRRSTPERAPALRPHPAPRAFRRSAKFEPKV